eukprot:gene4147-8244_t
MASERKAVIKNADMSEDMQQDAVDCASQALEKYNIEKDIAAYIKKEFDKKYNPTWHCIVGRNFEYLAAYAYLESCCHTVMIQSLLLQHTLPFLNFWILLYLENILKAQLRSLIFA